MNAPRIRAVIIDGPADAETIAQIRAAISDPRQVIVYARPTVEEILERVSHEMGVAIAEIRMPGGRAGRGLRARRAVIWLAYRLTGKGRKVIADVLHRDASTIHHALWRADDMREADPAFRMLTDRLFEYYSGERP